MFSSKYILVFINKSRQYYCKKIVFHKVTKYRGIVTCMVLNDKDKALITNKLTSVQRF